MRGIGARGLSGSQVSDWHNNVPRAIEIPSRGGYPFPADGLLVHYDALSLSGLSDGDTLPAVLTDLSGNGNNGGRVNSPTYQTAETPAGGPALRSSNGYYTVPSGTFAGTSAAHLFAYVESIPASGGIGGPWQMGGQFYSIYPWSDGQIYEGALTTTASNQRSNFSPSPAIRQAWRIFEVSSDGTWVCRIDGTQQVSTSKAYVAPSSDLRILGSALGVNDGIQIAEFMAYSRVLSTDEAAAVRSYLTGRHGATG